MKLFAAEHQINQRPSRIWTLVIFFTVFGIAQAQTQGDLLEKAYQKNSTKLLTEFFQDWSREIQPISEEELTTLNDTLRQVYAVFTAFYKPLNIDSFGNSERGNDIYKNVNFLVVQNIIKFYFEEKVYWTEEEEDEFVVNYINNNVKDESKRETLLTRTDGKIAYKVLSFYGPKSDIHYYKRIPTKVDSIVNFRPRIDCNGLPPVYLSPSYKEILNAYLGSTNKLTNKNDSLNPEHETKEREKRKKFLESQIRIFSGHWGPTWHLISHPHVSSITFDHKMNYAQINFRVVYEFGSAILKNDYGNWVMISSEISWIE